MKALTPRQQDVYEAIRDHWREVGRPPSFKDLQERVKLSVLPLRRHVLILEEKGYLAPRRPHTARDIYLAKPVGEAGIKKTRPWGPGYLNFKQSAE